jgi:hypothetical protein
LTILTFALRALNCELPIKGRSMNFDYSEFIDFCQQSPFSFVVMLLLVTFTIRAAVFQVRNRGK